MSQELTNARRSLSRVSSDLKQGQYISAATSVRDGARMFGRVPMIKNEAEELSGLLQTACQYLSYSGELAKLFPLAIVYTPGNEAVLVDIMNQLIEVLQETSAADAVKKHAEHKALLLEKGRKQLQENRLDEARQTFRQLSEDYADDAELAAAVGEIFMHAGQLDDAFRYLAAAVKLAPDAANLLNKLGIVLRKMRNFEQSEKVYKRAIALEAGDANLYFNMGRMYLEWQNWPRALECAEQSRALDPAFSEAAKLASYARRMAEES